MNNTTELKVAIPVKKIKESILDAQDALTNEELQNKSKLMLQDILLYMPQISKISHRVGFGCWNIPESYEIRFKVDGDGEDEFNKLKKGGLNPHYVKDKLLGGAWSL